MILDDSNLKVHSATSWASRKGCVQKAGLFSVAQERRMPFLIHRHLATIHKCPREKKARTGVCASGTPSPFAGTADNPCLQKPISPMQVHCAGRHNRVDCLLEFALPGKEGRQQGPASSLAEKAMTGSHSPSAM